MLMLVQSENEEGSVHIFHDKYLESSQMQIMYCFKHISHDIHINLAILKSLQTLFACV